MKTFIALLLIYVSNMAAQGFDFDKKSKDKVVIPFRLINNLIFIPIEVNGVELTFLLDTGVDETILFSLDDVTEVSFLMAEKIKLQGMGTEESVEALKTVNNVLKIRGLTDKAHDIYMVLNEDFNFSSNIGIPVNGIIGYNFFRNHIVEINYEREKIIVYKEMASQHDKIKSKFTPIDITIEGHKPYATALLSISEPRFVAKLLVDTGSSDSVWLFTERDAQITVPENQIDDFLGRGFSGEIHGKRARLRELILNSYSLKNPIASFPDSVSINGLTMVKGRIGSLGGEIMKRFNVVFDYRNHKMYLRKNSNFNLPFSYNMSGMEVHHEGLDWVKETVEMKPARIVASFDSNGDKMPNRFTYKFQLKPIYAISEVRKDSPADLCGLLKGDRLIAINNRSSYHYTLEEINTLFKSDEGREIEVQIERANKIMNFNFRLKSIL
ncbi:MAG TPA: aspartyl protease family protein [Flavobacterium sp.]|jgi:hypothetical protein